MKFLDQYIVQNKQGSYTFSFWRRKSELVSKFRPILELKNATN